MQHHIKHPELRRLFVVAQLLLEAQQQQQAAHADDTTPQPQSDDNVNPEGESHDAQEA